MDLFKDIECPDKEPKQCGFCKEYKMYQFHFQDENGKTNKDVNQWVVSITFFKQKKRTLT